MNFHILTLFPEMILQGLNTSITGRAIKQNKITVNAVNIRDFTEDKHRKVDDYTYGGGAGMLMQPQPVYDAWDSVRRKIEFGEEIDAADDSIIDKHKIKKTSNRPIRTIYVTPQGQTFHQQMAKDFSKEENLVILCGHYEGIDERVLEEIVTDYVSIGDYVLTGGELAAMVMVDTIARLVPGVLNNDVSAETESFHGNLLEYPQYSRPEVWHGKEVPQVLLSGNQKQINAWRLEQSVIRTRKRRPDLYEKYQNLQECMQMLMAQKFLHIDMVECIRRGRAELVYQDAKEILLRDIVSDVYFHTNLELARRVTENISDIPQNVEFLSKLPLVKLAKIHCIVLHQEAVIPKAEECLFMKAGSACYQAVCTRREKLPVSGLYRADGKPMDDGLVIRPLQVEHAQVAANAYLEYGYLAGKEHSEEVKRENLLYIMKRIMEGEMFGAFFQSEDGSELLAGFIGKHSEGSLGMLTIFPEYRRRRLGFALETYMINRDLEQGFTPYGQVKSDNEASRILQDKMGLYLSKTPIFWME